MIMIGGCCYGDGGGNNGGIGSGDGIGSGGVGVGCCWVVLVVVYRQTPTIIKYVWLRRAPILCNI